MVEVYSTNMSPNQAILVSFVALIVLLTVLNYAFRITMTRVFNVRFIEDRVPWSLSELAIIGFAICVFYAASLVVHFGRTLLTEDDRATDCLTCCLPSSPMDIVTLFGIPMVCALAVLLGMGKVI